MKSIKFNQDGITAILEGRKTMTRRPIKDCGNTFKILNTFDSSRKYSLGVLINEYSKYKIGETVRVESPYHVVTDTKIVETETFSLSDIYLKITNIKVERLQDISEDDCIKEGIQLNFLDDETINGSHFSYGNDWVFEKIAFQNDIWEKLPYQAPYDWNSNPFVFVYEFEVVK